MPKICPMFMEDKDGVEHHIGYAYFPDPIPGVDDDPFLYLPPFTNTLYDPYQVYDPEGQCWVPSGGECDRALTQEEIDWWMENYDKGQPDKHPDDPDCLCKVCQTKDTSLPE